MLLRGVFNLYHLTHTIRADLERTRRTVEKAKIRFAEARKALLAEGGGVVSIVYHPCEFVHKKFWDGVNFRKGANPPRKRMEAAAAKDSRGDRSSPIASSRITSRFMKRFDDVRFITASEAAKLYADRAKEMRFTPAHLEKIARKVDEATFQTHGDYTLSASEVFDLLNRYVELRGAGKKCETLSLTETPLGPTGRVTSLAEPITTDDSQFLRTSADVADYLRNTVGCRQPCGWAAPRSRQKRTCGRWPGWRWNCWPIGRCPRKSRSSRPRWRRRSTSRRTIRLCGNG